MKKIAVIALAIYTAVILLIKPFNGLDLLAVAGWYALWMNQINEREKRRKTE